MPRNTGVAPAEDFFGPDGPEEEGTWLDVIEFYQNVRRLYTTVMTPSQVNTLTEIPVYNAAKKKGYQRDPDARRARAAARHLLKGGIFPGSVIVSLRGEAAARVQVTTHGNGNYRMARMFIPKEVKLWLVDGQHRRAALQIVADDEPDRVSPTAFGVPVVIMVTTSEVEEALQFQTIHEQQKNVLTDLTNRILQREVEEKEGDPKTLIQTGQLGKYKDYVAVKVTEALAEDPDSPWYGAIRPVNPKQLPRGEGEQAHWPVTETSMTTSLMPFVRYMGTAPPHVCVEVAKTFWTAVKERCPRAWKDPESYPYLKKTPGIYIMHEILPTIHRKAMMELGAGNQTVFADLLEQAGVDDEYWHHDGPLQGIGGIGGYRLKAAELEARLFELV